MHAMSFGQTRVCIFVRDAWQGWQALLGQQLLESNMY